ncbi:GNAT family N-acetyltransferase [Pedobacter changchengzhani]|uniref:GNAT family N-acetyltransferase n=1 Tax=Pedobacter changchengzhani TaxID=2529274 RepID=A0A4R5MMC6_9SPHI|nr:GNAT family N-acetyltransferase [Pedobacter changchengzhani]TDG36890.1 GNAT family N-acetyltransferase [Pedobacter changchengzhani]
MIRKALPTDAKAIAPLIVQAMGKLANKFSNTDDELKTLNLFEHFIGEKDNQYSFENTIIFEEDGVILGALNAYNGANLLLLRDNFLTYLKTYKNLKDFNPERETQEGEFYFDTLSVNSKAQGRGIGKQLITSGIKWAKNLGHQKIGLLVAFENQRALSIYEKIGFKIENDIKFVGDDYHHMVFKINP